MLNSAEFATATSRALNKVLFGSRVSSDEDIVSQWGTIGISYALNLILIFPLVATGFALAGYYHPTSAPLTDPNLRTIVGISNLITFALTYVASLTWSMHPKAIEIQKAAEGSVGELIIPVAVFSIFSMGLMAALFIFLDFGIVIGIVFFNAGLLQIKTARREIMTSRRADKSNQETEHQ